MFKPTPKPKTKKCPTCKGDGGRDHPITRCWDECRLCHGTGNVRADGKPWDECPNCGAKPKKRVYKKGYICGNGHTYFYLDEVR